MNCTFHHNREAEYQCANCGAPICETCYDVSTMHWCPTCFGEGVAKEAEEAEREIKSIKKELKVIYGGLILGLVISLALFVWMIMENGIAGLGMGAFWSIIVLGVCGSFLMLVKRFIASLKGSGNDGWWMALILFMIFLIIAPITTIIKLISCNKNLKQVTYIYNEDLKILALLDQYIANANAPEEEPVSDTVSDVDF